MTKSGLFWHLEFGLFLGVNKGVVVATHKKYPKKWGKICAYVCVRKKGLFLGGYSEFCLGSLFFKVPFKGCFKKF